MHFCITRSGEDNSASYLVSAGGAFSSTLIPALENIMSQMWPVAGFIVLVAQGCQPLPPGDLTAIAPAGETLPVGNVCLIRGWQDLYSSGVDRLASELQQSGVRAHVYRAAQWREVDRALARQYRGVADRQPLVLIGFSYGADDVVRIASDLKSAGVAVDLLITIDPVTPPPVSSNVRLTYNYFQTNGVWDVFPWFRGVPLRSAGAPQLINVDIRRQRPDLLEPDTAHANIAANPKLHREIIKKVLAVCPPRNSN